MNRERILVTGPAGRVGTEIIPLLRPHFALRLLDARPVTAVADDEVLTGDIRDPAIMGRACEGVKALVHLAAISDEDDFPTRLLPINLEGVYSVFEAARKAAVPKVLFASTAQTVLYYPKGQWITPEMPARPWTVYACTKLFGEALARLYSDRHGLSVIVLRVCWFQSYTSELLRIPDHDIQREWVSPRDLTQLIVRCIPSQLRFATFFAVSNNTGRFWDISNAQQMVGYQPKDNAADYLSKGT